MREDVNQREAASGFSLLGFGLCDTQAWLKFHLLAANTTQLGTYLTLRIEKQHPQHHQIGMPIEF